MDVSSHRVIMNGRSVTIPPGFRFRPDDAVLVFQYLAKKVLNHPMDLNLAEFRSCTIDPWDLLGERHKEVYYFIRKEDLVRTRGETLSGYWEESEDENVIEAANHPEFNFFEGRRKTFTFYFGRKPRGALTPWFMCEFRLMSSGSGRSPLPPSELSKWRVMKVGIKEYNEDDLNEEEENGSEESSEGEVVIN